MGRVCGRIREAVTFKNWSPGGPFLVTGLQGVKTMENHKPASPASGHGCLQEGVTYERVITPSPTPNLEAQGITLRVGLYPSTFLA